MPRRANTPKTRAKPEPGWLPKTVTEVPRCNGTLANGTRCRRTIGLDVHGYCSQHRPAA